MTRILPWLGIVSALAAIWFGAPLTGVAELSDAMVRGVVMVAALLVFLSSLLIRLLRRRRGAASIENALMQVPASDDGKVLSERMASALTRLKKTNGKGYLYDLPWYVIIGPPGAGKTTALLNSGLSFPVGGADTGGLEGFGGTRYCDWWFAEDAVLIDTAGRYTTQDSDGPRDSASWKSFLSLLRKARPKMPINGVILAFSVEDMMRGGPEALALHAETARARLAEMQSALKVSLPVYVLFTKADLILGFREFVQDFNADQRKVVWGATFQTRSRKTATVDEVEIEFDQLISRLGTIVTDQMQGEADAAARIAMLVFPQQFAHLRAPITSFLKDVFGASRETSRAFLRGFYFASGTQEGTPFDQALGAIQRLGDGESIAGSAFSPRFMSGKGKSFFLHDLLRKVIFAERNWVGYSRSTVMRTAVLRSLATMVLTVTTGAVIGLFGFAYWQNASLLAASNRYLLAYETASSQERERSLISDPDLSLIVPYLNALRAAPAGFEAGTPVETWVDAGLGQRARVHAAAVQAYSNGLEQMLRPRMVLAIENSFPFWDQDSLFADLFQGLKVYMLLGGQGPRGDDAAIKDYFDQVWSVQYGAGSDTHLTLNRHLEAMLELDDSRALLVGIQADTVSMARNALSRATLPELSYALVRDDPGSALLAPWDPVEQSGGALRWRRGVEEASLPGLFTADGFQRHMVPKLNAVGDQLEADQWVLGLSGTNLQTNALAPRVLELYAQEFVAQWRYTLAQIALAPLTNDAPSYETLAALATPDGSALTGLLEGVVANTTLMRPLPTVEEAFAPWVAALEGGVGTRPIDEVFNSLAQTRRSLTAAQPPVDTQVHAALDPLRSLRALLPPDIARLVSDAEAEIRRAVIPPDPATMQAALETSVLPSCTRDISGAYPFAPLDESVSLDQFADFFGPNGIMDRYFQTYLYPHVLLGESPLRPHPDSPLAQTLSPALLAEFERALRIQEAFFVGGPTPQIDLVLSHVDSTPDVVSAELVINDMLIETIKGDVPVLVQWPGPGVGAKLTLQPESSDGPDELQFRGSVWDVMRLIEDAPSRSVQGDRIRVTFVLGARQITYELRSRTSRNPFALRDLSQFSCPERIER